MGVEAGSNSLSVLRLAAISSWAAGALSMAAGEYVSVASQRDAEETDIEIERAEQRKGPKAQAKELDELTQIWAERGLDVHLARQVAKQLTKVDVIRTHCRDELGIDIDDKANPLQAALVSAGSFTAGASIPMVTSLFLRSPISRVCVVVGSTTCGLLMFGIIGSHLSRANLFTGGLRV